MSDQPLDYLIRLVEELRKLPYETEWLEFKHNNSDPDMIGERISALSNSAALEGKSSAYLIWGIADATQEIIGTTFDPQTQKVGQENLENWLLRLLNPKLDFTFSQLRVQDKPVVLLEIRRAENKPVQFKNIEFFRIGSHTKKLKDHPEKERQLWRIFDRTPFESLVAQADCSEEIVTRLLDYPAYFTLIAIDLPPNRAEIIARFEKETLIRQNDSGSWDILNLGAILFAKDLNDFPSLKRKSVRFIHYKGNNKLETLYEMEATKGYATNFRDLVHSINSAIPRNEVLGTALRKELPMFPEIAIREMVANALIHQDFFQTGTGPMVELFGTRLEITNPGLPLIETSRFLDSPPKSRNEGLASLMRRMGICEERGSGVDKIVEQTEFYQLPAPVFETTPEHTRSILFAHKEFEDMTTNRARPRLLHALLPPLPPP